MELPGSPTVSALAAFVRQQLAERLGDIVDLGGSVLGRLESTLDGALDGEVLPAASRPAEATVAAARQLATVIIGAAAPFAATSYSRARLIRQMHASGLLSDAEARVTRLALDSARDTGGAPH